MSDDHHPATSHCAHRDEAVFDRGEVRFAVVVHRQDFLTPLPCPAA